MTEENEKDEKSEVREIAKGIRSDVNEMLIRSRRLDRIVNCVFLFVMGACIGFFLDLLWTVVRT